RVEPASFAPIDQLVVGAPQAEGIAAAVRGFWPYLASMSTAPEAQAALASAARLEGPAVDGADDPLDALVRWRALAAAPVTPQMTAELRALLEADFPGGVGSPLLAALHRHGGELADLLTHAFVLEHPTAALAILE